MCAIIAFSLQEGIRTDMKLKNFAIVAIASTLILGACKYEEGPGISLRSKTDRVANEWELVSYTYDSTEGSKTNYLDRVNTPEFKLLFTMTRSNRYTIDMVKPLGDGKYETSHTGNNNAQWDSQEITAYLSQIPGHIRNMMNQGAWNFDKRHFKIQIFKELSYVDTMESQVLQHDWTIVKLKEKEMKVWGKDANNNRFDMTFKPINDESYWF
jgi:hypothetical protein